MLSSNTRKRNPALWRTRKAAVAAAIDAAGRDAAGRDWYVVGGQHRWGVVARRPNGVFFGPIRADNGDNYRRWYCG
jgi:hypothetical protein